VNVSRRDLLLIGAGALVGAAQCAAPAQAADETESHGISVFGDLKYPRDFAHFDYVDPKAPKGGIFSQIGPNRMFNQNFLTFNSLNSYILKGDAAQGMELTFASLMARASDEPDGMYGMAARAVRTSADGQTHRYLMRPEARFHDGTRLTAHDVAFSLANHFKFAAVQNRAGIYALPGLNGIKAAGATILRVAPDNGGISIVNPSKRQKIAYPICTFTYVIVPKQTAKAAELKQFIRWAVTKGQADGPKLLFSPLPKVVLKASLKTLNLVHT